MVVQGVKQDGISPSSQLKVRDPKSQSKRRQSASSVNPKYLNVSASIVTDIKDLAAEHETKQLVKSREEQQRVQNELAVEKQSTISLQQRSTKLQQEKDQMQALWQDAREGREDAIQKA